MMRSSGSDRCGRGSCCGAGPCRAGTLAARGSPHTDDFSPAGHARAPPAPGRSAPSPSPRGRQARQRFPCASDRRAQRARARRAGQPAAAACPAACRVAPPAAGLGPPDPRGTVDLPRRHRHQPPRGGSATRTGTDCERSCTATAAAKCCSPRHATPDTQRQTSAAARPRPPHGFRAYACRTRASRGRTDRRSPRKQHRRRHAPEPRGNRQPRR